MSIRTDQSSGISSRNTKIVPINVPLRLPKGFFFVLLSLYVNMQSNPTAVSAFTSSQSVSSFTTDRCMHNAIFTKKKGAISSSPQLNKQNTKFNSRKNRNTMQMHFGQSHSHHHHDHLNSKETKSITWKKIIIPSRRTSSRIAFSALMTLLPPLMFRNQWELALRITKVDIVAFIATSTILNLSQTIERQVQNMIINAKRLRDGVVKYSTPRMLGTSEKQIKQSRFLSENAADRVTYFGVFINLFLSIGKAIVGVTCHSAVLITDAGHSFSDLFSDFITLWAVQFGRLPPDDDHPYGHGKFESLGSLFLSLTLLATGISLGAVSNKRLTEILSIQLTSASQGKCFLTSASHLMPEVPTFPCLLMALVSVLSKEWLYRVTRDVGERLNSQVVIANAWHHRSDAYSSILALISIGMAMTFPSLIAADSAAGLLVAGMICMTGFEILGDSIKRLTEESTEEQHIAA